MKSQNARNHKIQEIMRFRK